MKHITTTPLKLLMFFAAILFLNSCKKETVHQTDDELYKAKFEAIVKQSRQSRTALDTPITGRAPIVLTFASYEQAYKFVSSQTRTSNDTLAIKKLSANKLQSISKSTIMSSSEGENTEGNLDEVSGFGSIAYSKNGISVAINANESWGTSMVLMIYNGGFSVTNGSTINTFEVQNPKLYYSGAGSQAQWIPIVTKGPYGDSAYWSDVASIVINVTDVTPGPTQYNMILKTKGTMKAILNPARFVTSMEAVLY
jgi:hypothetical protein